uniref:Uncharacterized protein n=1 Tax=Timema tahoe TaxID=61484 RepID=A0A7R9IEK3_9NEOP|nr:unnamed protein product [Timema tahoe]
MSTQSYYKDRLGFDPNEDFNNGGAFDKTQQGYEENLSKFKEEVNSHLRGWRVENHSGTHPPSVHPTKIRTSISPVLGSLVQHETSAFATEASDKFFVNEVKKLSLNFRTPSTDIREIQDSRLRICGCETGSCDRYPLVKNSPVKLLLRLHLRLFKD